MQSDDPRVIEIIDFIADEAGVDKSAVVQASTCYGHDNSYLADAVAKYPGPIRLV